MEDYIKRQAALEMFDEWVEATGALPKGTSYYYECRACIEDVPAEDVVPAAQGSGEGPCDGAGVAPAVYAAVCKERDDLKAELQRVIAGVHESRSEMDRMKAEKDAAVADLKKIAGVGKTWMCPYCGHNQSIEHGICNCELPIEKCAMPYTCFEWRGKEGKGDG